MIPKNDSAASTKGEQDCPQYAVLAAESLGFGFLLDFVFDELTRDHYRSQLY
jgi:hypothetical protein